MGRGDRVDPHGWREGVIMASISYRRALRWIVENDDTEFLNDENLEHGLSVTAALVADLFGKDDEAVFRDLKRERAKARGEG